MPGITHSWNGTVLTISSDSGTSSVDLKGDMGPRGPQGAPGISIGEGGDVDLSNYATKKYVDQEIESALEDFEPTNLDNYYTKTEVDAKIPDAENLATKTDVANATAGLATQDFVTSKIAEAQLGGGEGGDIDLSGFALKSEIPDVSNFITMAQVEAKGYQTAAQVNALIEAALAALDGDGEEY